MLVFALLIVCAQALAIQAGSFNNDAEALCAGKHIELVSLSQLEELERTVPEVNGCPINIESAIEELLAVIRDGSKDMCSVASIERFKQYYLKFLNTSAGHKFDLPESLKKFAIAYGMQISNLCKKNTVEVLTKESHNLLTEEDFKIVEQLTKDDSPVAQMLSASGDPGEIIMPGDLAPLFKSSGVEQKDFGSEKVFMQTAVSSYIKKLQSACQHRFKPVYEPLILPLIRLANIGFNYKDEPLKCAIKCSQVEREIAQWSRIVFMCESLDGIRLVEDKADQEQAEGTDGKLVRIITKEEAAAIEGTTPEELESEPVTDVVYEPVTHVTLGDVILDKSDSKLMGAIKALKTGDTEEELIKKRMASKGFDMILGHLKKGDIGFLISTGFKGMMKKHNKDGAAASPAEQLVKSLAEGGDFGSIDGAISHTRTSNDYLGFLYVFLIIASIIVLPTLAILLG